MAHHEINKNKMKNDIVLTVSLVISLLLVRLIMWATALDTKDYNIAIFFVLIFICIKITYNLFNRIVDKFSNSKNKK